MLNSLGITRLNIFRGMVINKYWVYCSFVKDLTSFYQNQSIENRINTFRHILKKPCSFSVSQFQLKIPSILKMTNAKKLKQFHIENRTPPNIVILHSLAHIQFNAFLAYADTSLRFGCSQEYNKLWNEGKQNISLDFAKQMQKIALDEGKHCLLLINRLRQMGYNFGDFPVISNLTNVISQTTQSVVERLALIAIVHQGRGIKSIQKLINKISHSNDEGSIKILRKIQSEQFDHFSIGLKWFKYFCFEQFKKKQINQSIQQDFQTFLQKQLKQINFKYKTNITLKQINID